MALYKRKLDFKTLFKARIIEIVIPIFITIPLAIYLRSYWALVIGTLVQNFVNAVFLTLVSRWRPSLFYSLNRLKEMISFTIWSMIEQITIWLTYYLDVFIVGTMLSQHLLGLYKTSSTLVGQIMGLITATTTPILFSSLSRLQNDRDGFERMFFKFQKIVGLMVIPLGVLIFCFSDIVTTILLGEQWMEASGFIGLWGLTSSFTIIFSNYASELYRAKGKPKLSVLAQILHIVVLLPTVLIAINYDFKVLYTSRALVRFEVIFVNWFIMYYALNFSVLKMIYNVLPSCFAALLMMIVYWCLPTTSLLYVQILYAFLCAIVFVLAVCWFKEERHIIFNLKQVIKTK